MSLVARTYLGMGAMVALILMVGGFAALRTSSLADTFIEYRATAKTSLLANEIAQNLAIARLSALNYRTSSDPQALDASTRATADVIRLIPSFSSALDGYVEQADVQEIPPLMAAYTAALNDVANLRKRRSELVEITVQSGRSAREKLSEMGQAALRSNDTRASAEVGVYNSNLLLGRFYLERFLTSNEPADFERSVKEIQAASTGLSAMVAKLAQSTQADIDGFSTAATELLETVQKQTGLYGKLDEIGPQALSLVNSAVEAVVNRQNTLGPAGTIMAQASITIVLSLVALGTLVGILFAFFLGRNISRNLQKITGDMTQLAEGNLELEIETGSKTHEICKMTDAMAVFLTNARKARDLDLEAKNTEERERERQRLEEDRDREAHQEAKRLCEENEQRDADRARMAMLESFQKDMERVMGEAASGNFSVRMSGKTKDQNLSSLANLVNQQLMSTETNVTDIVSGIGELAKGNLAVRIKGERQGVFLAMQEDFNASIAILSQTMSKILRSGSSVTKTSVDLKNSSKDMSKRAEDNAAMVEETSAAVEEITASIRQVVASAKAADQATQRVRQSADETRSVSTETEASINAMTDASAQINRVVKVIEDIAFQINLLALNAGVEAARAGEAGLGFSVVASEVRNLALRSQEAVQEITQVIEKSNLSVEAGAQQVGLSRQALEGIITEVEVASGQISEIASAVEEQARGIEEVNTAIRAIDVNAQKNASTLETMMLSSQSLSDEANQFSAALGEFEGVSGNEAIPAKKTVNAPLSRKHAAVPKSTPKVAATASQAAFATTDEEGWDEF